jgi:hypothetical protein
MEGTFVTVSKKCVWNTTAKEGSMPPFLFPLLLLVIFVCAFGYMVNRDAERRAREKKWNQYHDRV